ncbi:MAG: glycosyltransferase [Acidobacteriia bacterium]|nr:glycosyltransferase [Terriglobia bacterium]
MIALLGRRDTPTDGVEDYCTFLGRALEQRGVALKRFRVDWMNKDWIGALRQLRRDSEGWRGSWVLLQYTALGWSRRGFPLGAVAALWTVRRRGAHCAVVFHDPGRQGTGYRWVDRIRGACQDWVIRRLYAGAEKCIFADPLETVRWLPKNDAKSAFIPIGANIPQPERRAEAFGARNGAGKTVAVFCLSDLPNREREIGDIASAMRSAAANGSKLGVVFLGRGTAAAQPDIDRAFDGVPVQVSNLGLQSADEVSRTLSGSDAMLCVRGKLYPRRGSALAGIACGLPIVGYAGAAERTPLAEAGVELVPYRDREALGAALARVLTDESFHAELQDRNRRALEKYFGWSEIAKRYLEVLCTGTGTMADAH